MVPSRNEPRGPLNGNDGLQWSFPHSLLSTSKILRGKGSNIRGAGGFCSYFSLKKQRLPLEEEPSTRSKENPTEQTRNVCHIGTIQHDWFCLGSF